MGVQLSESLKQFLRQPLMVILGTASTDLRPAIARGMGVFEAEQEGHLEIVFSSWQWPETAPNIRETGRMAMTVVSPSKYTCYQVKGKAWVNTPKAAEIERSDGYIRSMAAELHGLGVPPNLTGPWLTNRDPLMATLNVSEVYVQTPGPNAGMLAGQRR
jgi:hypothetical protein